MSFDWMTVALQHYNYKKLKLFFLSLLWRLDASSLGLGQNVKLDEHHRTAITNMLLSADPKGWETYAVSMYYFIGDGQYGRLGTRSAMQGISDLGYNTYQLYTSGYEITIVCDDKPLAGVDQICHINEACHTQVAIKPFKNSQHEQAVRDIINNRKIN